MVTPARSLAASLGPSLGDGLLVAGLFATPLVAAGAIKIAYDLTLLFMFRGYDERRP